MQIGVRLKIFHTLFKMLIKIKFSGQIFGKQPNTKFHENPSKWEQRCSMRTDVGADMRTLIVVSGISAKAPNESSKLLQLAL